MRRRSRFFDPAVGESSGGRPFLDSAEFGRLIRFDILRGCKSRPFEDHFQGREQPEVTGSEVRRVRWLSDDRAAQQATCPSVRYRGEELTAPATCIAVSSKLHLSASLKLALQMVPGSSTVQVI